MFRLCPPSRMRSYPICEYHDFDKRESTQSVDTFTKVTAFFRRLVFEIIFLKNILHWFLCKYLNRPHRPLPPSPLSILAQTYPCVSYIGKLYLSWGCFKTCKRNLLNCCLRYIQSYRKIAPLICGPTLPPGISVWTHLNIHYLIVLFNKVQFSGIWFLKKKDFSLYVFFS